MSCIRVCVCEWVCAPAGAGVTGAGLRPAPVIDQRWASNEAVNPIILLGDLTES